MNERWLGFHHERPFDLVFKVNVLGEANGFAIVQFRDKEKALIQSSFLKNTIKEAWAHKLIILEERLKHSNELRDCYINDMKKLKEDIAEEDAEIKSLKEYIRIAERIVKKDG